MREAQKSFTHFLLEFFRNQNFRRIKRFNISQEYSRDP